MAVHSHSLAKQMLTQSDSMNFAGLSTRLPSMMRCYRGVITGVLLMVVAWGMYLPSARYNFVYYDDVRLLLSHPELYGQTHFSADLKEIFLKSYPREEPLILRDVTWALDSQIFGFGNPFGYHLGNVVLHGIVIALMFAFLLLTTRRYGFALGATLAYLVLAIHTEPVDWIMGRKDILATLCMLLALCAQTRRLRAQSGPVQWVWYTLTLVCFLAGLLSKINVLTFPLVLFLHAVFLPYLDGERSFDAPFLWGRALLREVVLVCPSIAVSGLIYVWYSRILAQMGSRVDHSLGHLWNLLIVDPFCFWVYVQQIAFPWQLKLFYTWPGVRLTYPLWQIAASLATIGAIAGMGIWLFWRRKDLFFYYGTLFILMVPYMSLLGVGFWVAERYAYFSAAFLLILASAPIMAGLRHSSHTIRICVSVLVVVFVTNNVVQHFTYQAVWLNGETLWQYHIALPSPSPVAFENLAGYYYAQATAQRGTPQASVLIRKMEVVVDAGLTEFWRDRQRPPPRATYFLFFQKAIVQEVNGDPEAALVTLLTSDRLLPNFDATNLNLARLYRKLAPGFKEPRQRAVYASAARDRMTEYIELAFHSRPPPPEVCQELAEMRAECSSLPPSVSVETHN
jgi:hypothetical protein